MIRLMQWAAMPGLALMLAPGAAEAVCESVTPEAAVPACYDEKIAIIEAELDDVWQAARSRIDAVGGDEGQALRQHALTAQRAWEEYRFAECIDGVNAQMGGYAAAYNVRGECLIYTAKQRARQLVWRYRVPQEIAPISHNRTPL